MNRLTYKLKLEITTDHPVFARDQKAQLCKALRDLAFDIGEWKELQPARGGIPGGDSFDVGEYQITYFTRGA